MVLLAQIPTYVIGVLVVLFLLVSVILILTVLIQRPMGGGLSGAFGSGAGSGQTAFGAKTGDVLTVVTIVVFATWLLGAIGLNYATRPPAPPTGTQVNPTGSDAGQGASTQGEQAADQTDEGAAPAGQPAEEVGGASDDSGAGAESGGESGDEGSGETSPPGGG